MSTQLRCKCVVFEEFYKTVADVIPVESGAALHVHVLKLLLFFSCFVVKGYFWFHNVLQK